MRKTWTYSIRVPNPVWYLLNWRRLLAGAIASREIARFKKQILEVHYEFPYRYTTVGISARDEAPLAPYGWGGSPQGEPLEGSYFDRGQVKRDPAEIIDFGA